MAIHVSPDAKGKSSARTPDSAPRKSRIPSLEQIRVRAYQKYCARDGACGDALHDWLEAEHELRHAEQPGGKS